MKEYQHKTSRSYRLKRLIENASIRTGIRHSRRLTLSVYRDKEVTKRHAYSIKLGKNYELKIHTCGKLKRFKPRN